MATINTVSDSKYLTIPGGRLAYEVAGTGPVILCLPSMGDMRREFERFVPPLVEAGYRVITTDLRGMGESRGIFATYTIEALAADIQAILDAESVEQAFLVSCSISAASAGLFALEHPERVRGLVMISPMVYSATNKLIPALLTTLLHTPIVGRVFWGSYFKTLYPLHPLEADYLQEIKTMLKQPGSMRSVAGMALAPRLDERLTQLSVPTLAYFCTKDPDFMSEQGMRQAAARFQQQIPHAQIVILEGLGHYPHREAPEQVVPTVQQWLKARIQA
jgi:Predicted hydrolases or acyltransferases (alpha/beta hydrolase superfamily)